MIRIFVYGFFISVFLFGCADHNALQATQSDTVRKSAGLLPSITAAAQVKKVSAPSEVTLDIAVRQAVQKNPKIAEATWKFRLQQEKVSEARTSYLPTINGSFSANISEVTDQERKRGPVASVAASQLLYDFAKVSTQVQVQESGALARAMNLQVVIEALAQDVSHVLINLLRQDSLRAVATDHLKVSEKILRLVRSRMETGASDKADPLQAEAQLQKAKTRLLDVDFEKRKLTSELSLLLGYNGSIVVSDKGLARLKNSCEGVKPDWKSTPRIAHADAELDAVSGEAQLAKIDGLPRLSLEAKAQKNFSHWEDKFDYKVGLNLSSSLYSGGRLKSKRRSAGFAVEAAIANRKKVLDEEQRLLSEARIKFINIEQMHGLLLERESTMRATRDLYQVQYAETGTRTLLDLLFANEELYETRTSLVDSKYDSFQLNIDCLFAAGSLGRFFGISRN